MEHSSPLARLTDSAMRRRCAEVVAAAEQAPDAAAMLVVANAALARYFPSRAAAWTVIDPGRLLPSWPLHIENAPYEDSTPYWQREFLLDGSILFRDLAGRAVLVGRLHHETSGLLARSGALDRAGRQLPGHRRRHGQFHGGGHERASPAEVAPIIVSAYDPSAREQEVTRLLACASPEPEITGRGFVVVAVITLPVFRHRRGGDPGGCGRCGVDPYEMPVFR